MAEPSLWYKDTIIYELHVKAFFDANNDGIGDFQGLAQKLDYLCDLGIGTLWLLPFYPSPLRDDGYDIADYRNVHASYGNMRDFRAFLNAAHERGLRVITELVINHTSDQHPWFQKARTAKAGSAARDMYVWSDNDLRYKDARIIFSDTEKSNWTWDTEAKAYYWHRFFSHQPDLNFDNPKLVGEIIKVMRYWLDMGVDGVRLDAIPYLIERDGTDCENLTETHAVIKQLRAALDERYPDKLFLAEANQWPEDVLPYFGAGDECHMAYHFPLMPRMYMAIAQEDRHPITDIMRQTPDIPANCQWAIFLRNHDELTLEMVTNSERDYLWKFYANETRARLNFGIRRRLAPLLENDRRKVELLYGLLMSMPGTPIIYYGDEIGMGDNIFLGDRDGVRTPMQWTPDRNGGFSRTDPARLFLPPIMDPVYGYQARNVESQSGDPSSLLNWLKRLIAVRRRHTLFGRGRISFLYPGNRKVLAYLREDDEDSVLCVVNLSRAPQPVELDLSAFKGRVPVELLGRSAFPPIGDLPYFITLAGHGFYWFLLAEQAEAPAWHEPMTPPLPELMTLVLPRGPASLADDGRALRALYDRILPEYFGNQRWSGAKGTRITEVKQAARIEMPDTVESWTLALYDVATRDGNSQLYFVPQGIRWGDRGEAPIDALAPFTLARVRHRARVGSLYDAALEEHFAGAIVQSIQGSNADVPGLIFWKGQGFDDALGNEDLAGLPIKSMGREQSNSSLRIGEKMILKFYRKVHAGAHPELEMGRHLTEVAQFRNTPPTLGSVEMDTDGGRVALAILQGYVRNQGDGWQYALDHLGRSFDQVMIGGETDVMQDTGRDAFLAHMTTLGQRTAELHRALALPSEDAAFAPEAIARDDIQRWRARAHEQADNALAALRRESGEEAVKFVAGASALHGRLDALLPESLPMKKTRCHGDYHLGQIVIVQNDVFILDFEGEPTRPLAERRAKRLPLLDVAGMLRSIDYAGWAALLRFGLADDKARETMIAHLEVWKRETAAAFLAGYSETIGDCVSFPDDAETARRLIAFHVLEKACYEISYEAGYRPDWVAIPLKGALHLMSNELEGPWT